MNQDEGLDEIRSRWDAFIEEMKSFAKTCDERDSIPEFSRLVCAVKTGKRAQKFLDKKLKEARELEQLALAHRNSLHQNFGSAQYHRIYADFLKALGE